MLEELLKILSEDRYVSGERLSEGLGVSRVAVWKAIKRLEQLGYAVEAKPKVGYRLLARPNIPYPWEIKRRLTGAGIIGREIKYYDRLDSTQEVVKELAKEGAEEGLVVIAREQLRGRGRMGRVWFSPPGGLWMSMLLRPKVPPAKAPLLTLMAASSVSEALWRAYGVVGRIKWPNDVLVNGRKICGVLAEVEAEVDRVNYVALGIGVNLNVPLNSLPEKVRAEATSLQEVLGKEVDVVDFACKLLTLINAQYLEYLSRRFSNLIESWRSKLIGLGKEVLIKTVDGEIAGLAEDVDEDGALLVKVGSGDVVKVYSGDLTVLKHA